MELQQLKLFSSESSAQPAAPWLSFKMAESWFGEYCQHVTQGLLLLALAAWPRYRNMKFPDQSRRPNGFIISLINTTTHPVLAPPTICQVIQIFRNQNMTRFLQEYIWKIFVVKRSQELRLVSLLWQGFSSGTLWLNQTGQITWTLSIFCCICSNQFCLLAGVCIIMVEIFSFRFWRENRLKTWHIIVITLHKTENILLYLSTSTS